MTQSSSSSEDKKPEFVKGDKLVINALAWLKLCLIRNTKKGQETAFWGVTDPDNPMYVTDIECVKHYGRHSYVEFDDEALMDWTMQMAGQGIYADRCRRVWIHTHPGNSAAPSSVDWNTMNRLSAGAPYMIMLIVAMDNSTTCHMQSQLSCGDGSEHAPIRQTATMEVELDDSVDLAVSGMDVKFMIDYMNYLDEIDLDDLAKHIEERCRPYSEHPEEIEREEKRLALIEENKIRTASTAAYAGRGSVHERAPSSYAAGSPSAFGIKQPSPLEMVAQAIARGKKAEEKRAKVEAEQGASVVLHQFSLFTFDETIDWERIYHVSQHETITKAEINVIRESRYEALMDDAQRDYLARQPAFQQFKILEGYETRYHRTLTDAYADMSIPEYDAVQRIALDTALGVEDKDDNELLLLKESDEGDMSDDERLAREELDEVMKRWNEGDGSD